LRSCFSYSVSFLLTSHLLFLFLFVLFSSSSPHQRRLTVPTLLKLLAIILHPLLVILPFSASPHAPIDLIIPPPK
jgi:hypothetical protein